MSDIFWLPEEVAQIHQQGGTDLQQAMDSYERAGDWYASEDATAYVES